MELSIWVEGPGALAGAGAGATRGAIWGGISGLMRAAVVTDAKDAAIGGAKAGAVGGALGGAGRAYGAVRGLASAPSAAGRLPWTSWGNAQKVTVAGREYAQIGGRLYTQHAVERMMPSGLSGYVRSIAPAFVEDAIQTGTATTRVVDGVTRTIYTSGTVQVVTEQGGKIIVTVITH